MPNKKSKNYIITHPNVFVICWQKEIQITIDTVTESDCLCVL